MHHLEAVEIGDGWVLEMKGTVGFLAVPSLMSSLSEIPEGATVRLDADLNFLDHAALTVLMDWMDAHRATGGTVLIDEAGVPWVTSAHDGNPLVSRVSSGGASVSAPRWFEARVDNSEHSTTLQGIDDFHAHHETFHTALSPLAQGQRPRTLFITCCDSRVVPHVITASGPGDLFIVRTIGNLIPRWTGGPMPETGSFVAAAIDYAIGVLQVEEIVICGHSQCGAIGAAVQGSPDGNLDALRHWLKALPEEVVQDARRVRAGEMSVDELARRNVRVQLDHLNSHPAVARAGERGQIRTLGIYFDIERARADVLTPA